MARSARPQRGGGGVRGRATGVDVVNKPNARGRFDGRAERTGDVSPSVGPSEPTLMPDLPRPSEQRRDRQLPTPAQLVREPFGRVVSADQHACSIGRDERQRGHPRPLDPGDDEIRGLARKPAQPALLPPRDETAHAIVVLDRRARGGERESASRALPAAPDGPRGRRPATLAERRTKQRQALPARPAQLLPARGADDAANRQ